MAASVLKVITSDCKLGQYSSSSITLLLAVVFVFHRLWRAYGTPLRGTPGPFLAKFTRMWYLRNVWRGDFEKVNSKLHKELGPVVRIAPNEYSLDDLNAIKVIYGHGSQSIKAPWYYAGGHPDPSRYDIFTDRDIKRHAETRRRVASLYSMTSLVRMEQQVDDCAHRMITRLEEFAHTKTTINLQEWCQYWAFDTISLITVAKRFGFLDSGSDQMGLIRAINIYLIHNANVGIYSEWHPIVSYLKYLLGVPGLEYIRDFCQHQIDERFDAIKTATGDSEGDGDFLGKLLNMHIQAPDKFTMYHILITCAANIGAGSDTTSITMTAIMYYLMQNPHMYRKLRAEVDEKISAKASPDDIISFSEAQSMPYLQACIKEGLRMHPATGLPLARVVPKGGANICDRYFPQGAIVGINTWVAHRNTEVFGDDADSYRPDRWLEDPKRTSRMEKYLISFGAGARTCIGKNISLLEISKLVPELVRRFDIDIADHSQELKTENVWFVKQKNLRVNISLR